jgi:flagellar motility protein MotE (MotC chaperone)
VPDWISTADLPLDDVSDFVSLRECLERVFARAGSPSLRDIERLSQTMPGATPLSRSKLSRMRRGLGDVARAELATLLKVLGVDPADWQRWAAAWGRAAERQTVGLAVQGRAQGSDDVYEVPRMVAEQIRDLQHDAVTDMRATREELVAIQAGSSASALPSELDQALRRLVNALEDAIAGVHSVPEVRSEEDESSNIELDDADAEFRPVSEQALRDVEWFRQMLKHVTPAVAGEILVGLDPVRVRELAEADPSLVVPIISTLRAERVAGWLADWDPDVARTLLSELSPRAAVYLLEHLQQSTSVEFLARMTPGAAAGIVNACPAQVAAAYVAELDPDVAAALLNRVHIATAAVVLRQLREHDHSVKAIFQLMDPVVRTNVQEETDRVLADENMAMALTEWTTDQRQPIQGTKRTDKVDQSTHGPVVDDSHHGAPRTNRQGEH